MIQYGIWDEDKGCWVDETVGLGYNECLQIGYDVIGKGKLPVITQYEMLKFMVENRFDLRPLSND